VARSVGRDTDGTWLQISLIVNAEKLDVLVPADRRLLTVLREDLRLTGTKVGCAVGVCGVCTVLVDGQPTSSCLTLAAQVDGCEILTVEGLDGDPELERLQADFISEGGFQCGFCTGGQLVAAAARLGKETSADTADDLRGHLCRCTGYYGIVRAIEKAGS
jgi:aerobic carbon-monoxide dehydrogenase small subunit